MEDGTLHLDLHGSLPEPGGFGRASVPAPEGTGHGLRGMRERVALVGGSLRAGRTADGWRLTASLPAVPPSPARPEGGPA